MSQDQHYIPQTYLKGFLNAGKQLYCLRKDAPKLPNKLRQTSPAGVGYYPDFNVIKDERQMGLFGVKDANAIETLFKKQQEDHYKRAVDRLLNAEISIGVDDAKGIISTLLSFKQRNPELRKFFENRDLLIEVWNNRINEFISKRSDIEAESKQHGTTFEKIIAMFEERRDALANSSDAASIVHTQAMLSYLSGQSETINTTAGWLLKSVWELTESPAEYPFITSDNPGFTFDLSNKVHNLNFSEESGFFFPITSRFALTIDQKDPTFVGEVVSKNIIHAKADAKLVRLLNSYTYKISHKYILGSNETTLRQAWLDNH